MSLVLNTNQSWGGWYELSNEFLWRYPDFKESLLLYFNKILRFEIGQNIVNTWTFVAEINNTKINYWSWTLIAPNYFYWKNNSNTSETTPCWFAFPQPNFTKRIWICKQLNWWEIIWKKVIFWRPLWILVTNNYKTNTATIKYTVRLLHQDWTLTNVSEKIFNIWEGQSWSTTIVSYFDDKPYTSQVSDFFYNSVLEWTSLVEWSGVVAQEWDYVVVDVEWTWLTFSGTWSNQFMWVFFWYESTNNPSRRIEPIQISVE